MAMRDFLQAKLVRWGLWGLGLGTGPLLAIILLASIGLWPDPEPNPVGPGLLAALTFWPSVICLVMGVVQVSQSKRSAK
jgi:hypothetical protein